MTENLSPDLIKEFVLNAHGNLSRVKELLSEHPDLLHRSHQWGEDDFESPIQAAAHVGSRDVALYLLEKGAEYDITVAAMLGNADDVKRLLEEDPARAKAVGAHGIPLMPHAAFSGDTAITQMVLDHGSRDGISMAVFSAIAGGHAEMVQWLLANGANVRDAQNYQGKTPLQIAEETGQTTIAAILRDHVAD